MVAVVAVGRVAEAAGLKEFFVALARRVDDRFNGFPRGVTVSDGVVRDAMEPCRHEGRGSVRFIVGVGARVANAWY